MSQHFSIGPDSPAPKSNQIWGLGSIIGERQKIIGDPSDYDDMDEVAEAVRASFEEESEEAQFGPRSTASKHVFVGLSNEPDRDMYYTSYIHIEFEPSQEQAVFSYLSAQAELVGNDLYELAEALEPLLEDLRQQPGVISAGPIAFAHPWK